MNIFSHAIVESSGMFSYLQSVKIADQFSHHECTVEVTTVENESRPSAMNVNSRFLETMSQILV